MLTPRQVEGMVADWLTLNYIPSGAGIDVETDARYQTLLHLFTAAILYRHATPDVRSQIDAARRRLQGLTGIRCTLATRKAQQKERTRKKTEKQAPSPTPLTEEKENKKEKEEKTPPTAAGAKASPDLEEIMEFKNRREGFRMACLCYRGQYDDQLLTNFFNYWSEEDDKLYMRWERERFWNLQKRLARWVKNSYASADTAAALRLSKAQQRQQQTATQQAADAQAAAERERQQQERDRQREADRQQSMTTDEYISQNPNSLMARIARERQEKERRKAGKGGAA